MFYKKATGDFDLKHVTPAKSSIVSYDGGNIPVLGTVKLQVWRGSFTCLLLCRLVESKENYLMPTIEDIATRLHGA